MKAKYKGNRPEDNLTVGRKYDVEDLECKKGFEVSEILLENDKKETRWYSVEHFVMYAEATAAMKEAAAVEESVTAQNSLIITTGNAIDVFKGIEAQIMQVIEGKAGNMQTLGRKEHATLHRH